MMEILSTVEPAPMESVEQPQEEGRPARPSTRELLPTGARRIVVAAVGAALMVASLAAFGFTGRGLVGAVLCPVLVVLAAIDFEHRILPNDIIGPAVLAIGLIIAAADAGSFLTHLAAGAALGGFFLAFALIFRGSLGLGDAKLGFLLGLALGASTFAAVLIAFAGLLVNALWILARQGFDARGKAIAFGPYLALGGILAFFFG